MKPSAERFLSAKQAKLDRAARARRPPNVTRAGIEAAALRYLERFDCSVARLRKVLGQRIAKAARAGVAEAAAAPAIVEELLLRYQSSGLIDDQRFAKNFSARQRDRGMSGRMIEQKLRARGITAEVVQELLPRGESAAIELEAARAFARRRRLGPHRKPEVREAYRRKDLMAMARAGFNYDTASRVIGNASVIGGFSPAPAEVNSAAPHPRVWGPGPKQLSTDSSAEDDEF